MTPGKRIKKIREELLDLTQEGFGEPLGFKWYKVKDIESGKIKVSPEIATLIENIYSFKFEWLLTGKGPMKKEELSAGAESSHLNKDAKDSSPQTESETAKADQIKISEDLFLATRVLESGTAYATALHLNIRSFAMAIDAEERISVLESNQRGFEKKVSAEIAALRKEVNRLKATYEAPDGGDGHLTDTSKEAM